MTPPTPIPAAIVWFRDDLRAQDHAALQAAATSRAPVLPLLVDEWPAHRHAPGRRARWWRAKAALSLEDALAKLGLPLVARRGNPIAEILQVVRETGARTVHAMASVDPHARETETLLAMRLSQEGARLVLHAGNLLHDPDTLRTKSGTPYKVFTPFHAALADLLKTPPPETPLPRKIEAPRSIPQGVPLPRPDPAGAPASPMAHARMDWTPAVQAERIIARFLDSSALDAYATNRDFPAIDGTSRLSPWLACGQVSPRQVLRLLKGAPASLAAPFVRQLAWREFAAHLLANNPSFQDQPLDMRFARGAPALDEDLLERWKQGLTGIPIVDAGMRQLLHSGWMHNRVRMLAASLWIKHWQQPWQAGADWFREALVDYDAANNAMGWQWVAGCGADAAPYFRVFNPVTQALKFDPEGAYVRRWIPELAALPAPFIHSPWEAPAQALESAHVIPGKTYPTPVVLPDEGRRRAMERWARIRAVEQPRIEPIPAQGFS